MSQRSWIRLNEGAYRSLLWLYPRPFRERFGAAMICAFGECAVEARRRSGGRGLVGLWVRTVGDAVGTGLVLRASVLRARLRPRHHGAIGDASHGAGVGGALERLLYDLRYAIRGLRRSPAFAFAAITTLSVGIGANTAVFSVVHGVLLKPLPFENAQRLLLLRQDRTEVDGISVGFSVTEIEALRSQPVFDALVEYHNMTFTLLGGVEPERVLTGIVSWQYFDFLGVETLLGRAFEPGDEAADAEPILVLSHDYWQRSHGGDPEIVGKSVILNDRQHRVVGVLPPVPQYPVRHDIYMPVSACPFRSAPDFIADPSRRMMGIVARMAPERRLADAEAAIDVTSRELRSRHARAYPAEAGLQMVASDMRAELTRRARPKLALLTVAALLVLLSGCANVANLSLVRMLRMRRETAVRAALGAGRLRLVRQRVAESVVLGAGGALLGALVAVVGLETLTGFAARYTTRAVEIRVDGAVLAFCAGVALLSALLAGLAPALPAMDGLSGALRAGRRRLSPGGVRKTRQLIIGAQVALSVMLLTGAGLTLRSLANLHAVALGFDADRVVGVHLHMNPAVYREMSDRRQFVDRALEALGSLPGVTAAAAASRMPLVDLDDRTFAFDARGGPEAVTTSVRAGVVGVSPGYGEAMGLSVRDGDWDVGWIDAEAVSVVINRRMAETFWPDRSPVGAVLSSGLRGMPVAEFRVAGVVDNERDRLATPPIPQMYIPLWIASVGDSLLFRSADDPAATRDAVVTALRAIDPEMALGSQVLADVRLDAIAPPRLVALLFSAFAAVAVLVAATGISGLIAYLVNERTREIGIRMALGAELQAVRAMLLRQGLRPVLAGLVVGLGGAVGVSWVLRDGLFDVPPWDPVTYGGVAVLAVAVAAAASLLPTRRAATISPSAALRAE